MSLLETLIMLAIAGLIGAFAEFLIGFSLSGIIGAIIVMGKAESDNYIALILGFLAVILGTLNVVGGFVVTDRMLEMFKSKKKKS